MDRGGLPGTISPVPLESDSPTPTAHEVDSSLGEGEFALANKGNVYIIPDKPSKGLIVLRC